MNFLSVCEESSFLSTILFVKRILEIICLIVPIALIVMATIEVMKIVFNPDPKVIKSVTTKTIHKTIAAVAVFFVPTLIGLLTNGLATTNYKSTSCWINANNETIAYYKSVEEARIKEEEQKRKAEKEQAEEERLRVNAIREAARAENEKEANKAAAEASKGSTGTASSLAAKLVQVAEEEYNKHMSEPNEIAYTYGPIDGYGQGGYDYPWCAAFVWYCSQKAGVYPTKVSRKTASATSYLNYFKEGKDGTRFEVSAGFGGNYVPKMGDYIIFNGSQVNNGTATHIGIVKGVSGNEVLYYDGNCNNTVCDSHKLLTSKYIVGYGVWE